MRKFAKIALAAACFATAAVAHAAEPFKIGFIIHLPLLVNKPLPAPNFTCSSMAMK